MDGSHHQRLRRAVFSLEGLSVGDAFGQCFFAAEDEVAERLATRTLPPAPWPFTDDTLMAVSVCSVLSRSGYIDQDALAASFCERYDYSRGYGPSMHRLLAEISEGGDWRVAAPRQFGGMGSFGNGAAMRVAPLGAYFADDFALLAAEAEKSSVVTHTHPDAVAGAVAVAVAAALTCRFAEAGAVPSFEEFLGGVIERVPSGGVRNGLLRAADIGEDASVPLAVSVLGNGTKLSAADTVPFALWVAARNPGRFTEALWEAASGLGDRDTIGAIVGGVVVLSVGEAGIPPAWREARELRPGV